MTGILLWSEGYWSKFALDLSILIHGMEAILATLAIIVWHFYAVHWKPGQFPMSKVWIDGKMSNHHLQEEHGLQYARWSLRENLRRSNKRWIMMNRRIS